MNCSLRSAKQCYITELALPQLMGDIPLVSGLIFIIFHLKGQSQGLKLILIFKLMISICTFSLLQARKLFHKCPHFHIFLKLICHLYVNPIAVTVTEDLVITMIYKLDSKKATYCDKLPIKFIETCHEVMGKLFTVLVNKSTSTGKFPEL